MELEWLKDYWLSILGGGLLLALLVAGGVDQAIGGKLDAILKELRKRP